MITDFDLNLFMLNPNPLISCRFELRDYVIVNCTWLYSIAVAPQCVRHDGCTM